MQIAEGIYTIHQSKMIHRDLKPDNILIKKYNNNVLAAICDFGSTKRHITPQNTANVTTPIYASPEISCNIYDEKVDMYSLGLIIFKLITHYDLLSGHSNNQIVE